MRVPAALLAVVLMATACGDAAGKSEAKKACHGWDVLTDPKYHDEPPRKLDDVKAMAAKAASEDSRYKALADALVAWADTARQQDALLGGNTSTMTPQAKALAQVDAASLRHADAVRAACRKARA